LTYTITLTNTGTADATNVCVTDTIPLNTSYRPGSFQVSPAVGSGGFVSGPNLISWCGPVTVAQPVTIKFAVNITMGADQTGVITNTATINDGVNQPFDRSVITRVGMLYVECPPEANVYHSGEDLSVNLNVSNVADLQGVQVHITFDPDKLAVTGVDGTAWWSPALWPVKTWDNTAGTIDIATTLNHQPVGKSGAGTIAVLHFRAKGGGSSPLTINEGSVLSSAPFPAIVRMPHNRRSCTAFVTGRQVQGRVILQGRTDLANPGPDYSGAQIFINDETTPVTTTLADGSYRFWTPSSHFTVTVKMDGYLWARRVVDPGEVTVVPLPDVSLHGGDVVGGNVTVTRAGGCDPGGDVVIPGPPDGRVDVQDLTFVGTKFGMSQAGNPDRWGPDPCYPYYGPYDPQNYDLAYRADITGDKVIDILDLVAVGTNFMSTAPGPW